VSAEVEMTRDHSYDWQWCEMFNGAHDPMAELDIHQFPCLKDNYGVLIHDRSTGLTASIDAPCADAVNRALTETGWWLTHIFTTHHHSDHTGGNLLLKQQTGCTIVGPASEAARIPGIDLAVQDGDQVPFGTWKVTVLDTPGHTLGHVSYWIPEASVAFVGDTLFAMGCGRVLEGSNEMMWVSLQRLAHLPPETTVYCGHEYTAANAEFALTIEPDNLALRQRAHDTSQLRSAGKPTVPTTIGVELETNVFLRPQIAAIRNKLNMRAAADWKVFAEIRDRKNRF
jgi:hydroxyacylglutathione hydrolase